MAASLATRSLPLVNIRLYGMRAAAAQWAFSSNQVTCSLNHAMRSMIARYAGVGSPTISASSARTARKNRFSRLGPSTPSRRKSRECGLILR
jgi:hypothetical protein